MQTWPIQDAKARFSEFLETCLAQGPQMVTKRGSEAAVLVAVDEWRRLQAAARPSLKGPSSFRVDSNTQNRWSSSSPVGMWAGCI